MRASEFGSFGWGMFLALAIAQYLSGLDRGGDGWMDGWDQMGSAMCVC